MAVQLKLFYVLCSGLIGLAWGRNGTEENAKNVTKRHNILGDFGAWDPEIALFQAGLFLAENTFDLKAFRLAEQLLHHGIVLGTQQPNIHQQQELATAPPRNPTKPIYHYTPLPPGTFPLPKPEDQERDAPQPRPAEPQYLYGNQVPNYPATQGYYSYPAHTDGFPSPYLYAPSYTSLPYWTSNNHQVYYK